MKVDLLYSPGCERCAAVRAELQATAQQTVPGLTWQEINVLEAVDYVVKLGALTLPALAIDGELVFASLPSPEQLRRELARRLVTSHA